MTQDEIIRMARDAGSIDSEDVILTVYAAFAANEREKQAEQEPVHWVVPDFGFLFPSEDAAQRYLINIESDARPTPCYAAPVRTKDLTDDEIAEIHGCPPAEWVVHFARAVIAADRELNK